MESKDNRDLDLDINFRSSAASEIEPEPKPELELEINLSDIDAVGDYKNSGNSNLEDCMGSGNDVPIEGNLASPRNNYSIYYKHLYSDRLKYFCTKLEKKYNIDNID